MVGGKFVRVIGATNKLNAKCIVVRLGMLFMISRRYRGIRLGFTDEDKLAMYCILVVEWMHPA
jgi:hypothetical protein